MLLTLGTGIGGGIVARGELLLGNRWGAGEIGHHQIRPTDGFICNCGKVGCFEAQASGTGLIRHAFAVAPSFPRSTLLDVAREKLSSKKIRKAAQAGDGHALAAWKNFIGDLSIGLANIIAFTNPQTIALGGGVSSAEGFMLDAVRPRVDELTTMVPKGTTEIVVASLGNDAGQVGAATMAFRGGLAVGNRCALRTLLAAAFLALVAMPAQSQSSDPIHKIRHVIIIMQENRSFDTYFGTFPGADGIPMRNGVPAVCVPDPSGEQLRASLLRFERSQSRRPA